MIIRKACKYRLNTNAETEQLMSQYAGNCRWVWNKALAVNLHYLEQKQPMLWYHELDWFVKLWKISDEYAFLKRSPAQTLQQTLKQQERAFKDAFDSQQPLKKIPTRKKKGERDSFTFPQGFKIDGRRIFLPKIGWVNFRKSRDIEGTPKNVTVSRQGKHWFVSIQVEAELPEPAHPSTTIVGLDMGIKRLFTQSDGHFEEPIEVGFWQAKIKHLQKRLARMVKQKAGLNREILNQGWGLFKTFLEYKQCWAGGQVVSVDPKYTRQECPGCHHTSKDNRQAQADFECVVCGFSENADTVGANNILSRGIQKMRDEGRDTGDASSGWLKQVLEDTARLACEVSDAVRSPAAGTRQSSDTLEPALV